MIVRTKIHSPEAPDSVDVEIHFQMQKYRFDRHIIPVTLIHVIRTDNGVDIMHKLTEFEQANLSLLCLSRVNDTYCDHYGNTIETETHYQPNLVEPIWNTH